ncbi:MAG: alpha/beta hydrolase [Ahrensia sp.]|nr:alpha/beta hydrolase [Ahrensia sp.]
MARTGRLNSAFLLTSRRGHIDDFSQYAADLDLFFTDVVLPECRAPFYIVAHSTGSLAALYAAPMLANRVRRMMLCSPFLGFSPTNF